MELGNLNSDIAVQHTRTRKRKRTSSTASLSTSPALDGAVDLELTPPAEPAAARYDGSRLSELEDEDGDDSDLLATGLHVLQTQAAALTAITALYAASAGARRNFRGAVNAILDAQRSKNRLIVCGVGKSAYIAQKFVATCKSLSIRASFLHACEAVHGDLGDVRSGDVVLFVSYSGRTPELMNVLPHLPEDVRIIALTGRTEADDCLLLADAPQGILLTAPVVETEVASFGVAAPSTSTTVALAVSDMLALTLAERMHRKRKGEVFSRNHPGGAIGMNASGKRVKRTVDVTALVLPSPEISGSDDR